MRLILTCFLILGLLSWLPPPARAQGLGDGIDTTALEAALPDRTLKRLRAQPTRYLEEAVSLILGYGGPQGLDLAGIDRFVASERAQVRAREVRRLLLADLDGDTRVDADEIRHLLAASSARQRGPLMLAHRAADGDGDGTVTCAELHRHADALAHREVSVEDAILLRSFLEFDLDENGFVALDEVTLAIRSFAGQGG